MGNGLTYKRRKLDSDYFGSGQSEIIDLESQTYEIYSELIERFGNRDIYGNFNNTEEYLITLKLLAASGQEKTHREIILFREVISKMTSKNFRTNSFLDIGIGNGELTRYFAPFFSRVTIVDQNKEILNNFVLNDKKIERINDSVQNYSSPLYNGDKYNFILLSHVLYYIEKSQREKLIKSLYELLSDDGILVVIYNSGGSRGKLGKHFNSEFDDLSDLHDIFLPKSKDAALSDFTCINIHYTIETFSSAYVDVIKRIANICLNDAKAEAKSEDLENFIVNNHTVLESNNTLFEISLEQNIIIIGKQQDEC